MARGRSAILSFAWRVSGRYARVEWKNEEGEKLVLAKQGYRVGLEFRLSEREREREGKKRKDNNKTVEQGKHWRVAQAANSTNFAREEKSRGGGNTRHIERTKKKSWI